MTKKIYFEPAGIIHSSQWDLISHPPVGYQFVADKSGGKSILTSDFLILKTSRFWEFLVPTNLVKARLEGYLKKIPEDIDLIYAYNHPVFRKKPWVVLVEWAHVLVGRHTRHFKRQKGLIERMLASDYCKGIMTWSEWAKKSMLLNYNCTDFEHKIEVVPQSVSRKDFQKSYGEDRVRLLFAGSANVPQYFESKGGKEVLEVFSILSRKYSNLEFVVRAKVPSYIKDKYKLRGNIQIIEDVIPWEQLEQEFMNADIFLYPTHELHNTVILDAMSYQLPVVTTEIGSTGRIEDGVTGFTAKNSEEVPYFWDGPGFRFIPTGATPQKRKLDRAIQSIDPQVVGELVEKTSLLVENSELRRKMGKAARWEVEEGKFSVTKRNEKLKEMFDKALS